MEIFGFEIKRANDSSDSLQAIVPQTHEDGATEVVAGAPTGMYGGTYIDIEGSAKNEAALVTKYREIAMHPECDFAIEDIITASSDYSEGTINGVKIDLSTWTKGTDSFTGSVIISGASLETNSIKLSDNTLLTGNNFFIEILEGNGGG